MVWYGMVMVSINFASLNHAKRAVHGPQASPTRTPGYLISWAMATSLWPLALAFAFGDLLVPWPLEICLCRGQGPGHGAGRGHARRTGNGLKPKAMAMGKTVMASSPRQSHQALSHGNRFRPWLEAMAMARASSLWPEKREYGYWV